MYITKEVQQELFRKYDTPPHVQAHCNAVAETARKLGIALNEHGYGLDIDLIYGAGLVHDVVRLDEDHAARGAEILHELGYHREAEIVAQHMKYGMENSAIYLNELDVLCFGDRLVKEDQYVGLEERMQYLIDKPGANPERTMRILLAKAHTQEIIDDVERILGMTFDELLG